MSIPKSILLGLTGFALLLEVRAYLSWRLSADIASNLQPYSAVSVAGLRVVDIPRWNRSPLSASCVWIRIAQVGPIETFWRCILSQHFEAQRPRGLRVGHLADSSSIWSPGCPTDDQRSAGADFGLLWVAWPASVKVDTTVLQLEAKELRSCYTDRVRP